MEVSYQDPASREPAPGGGCCTCVKSLARVHRGRGKPNRDIRAEASHSAGQTRCECRPTYRGRRTCSSERVVIPERGRIGDASNESGVAERGRSPFATQVGGSFSLDLPFSGFKGDAGSERFPALPFTHPKMLSELRRLCPSVLYDVLGRPEIVAAPFLETEVSRASMRD